MTRRPHARRRAPAPAAAAALLLPLVAGRAAAQDRLVGTRTVAASALTEAVWFNGGYTQAGLTGDAAVRVRRAAQFSVPLTAATPLGRAWTVDVTSVYTTSAVRYDAPFLGGLRRGGTDRVAGFSDLRARLTGRLLDDRVVITAGLNAPTGRTRLDSAQLAATRVFASPGLGLAPPPVGAGPSGTLGLLAARTVRQWAVAAGASYERRGTYAPVSAIVAGVQSLDFVPGDVLRFSLGGDGLVGRSRLNASLALDLFARDRLRGGGIPGATGAIPDATLATVQLGPVLSGDAQLNLAAPAVRDLVVWGAFRHRTPYRRDGLRVAGTSATYLDGGVRTTAPVTPRLDAFAAADVRYSTGLAGGGGIATAFYTTGSLTGGLSRRLGALTAQPFARAQIGRVRGRGADRGAVATMRGAAAGLTLLTRF